MEKILLIEDDADIREMLIDYLSGEGYQITAYADGVSVGKCGSERADQHQDCCREERKYAVAQNAGENLF